MVGAVEKLGPATLTKIREWVGHSQVSIRPVLDLASTDSVDEHDPPEWMREIVILRDGHCVFPWCTVDARATDLDHIDPYVPMDQGGPPGQTNPHNLGLPVPATSPLQNLRPLALPKTRRRHLRMARPPRPQLPRHPTRHPRDPHQLTAAGPIPGSHRAIGPAVLPGSRSAGRDSQTWSRNLSNTRAPNSSASTGTRSSTPWKSAVKSRSAGSRSGAKP